MCLLLPYNQKGVNPYVTDLCGIKLRIVVVINLDDSRYEVLHLDVLDQINSDALCLSRQRVEVEIELVVLWIDLPPFDTCNK
jgi:hypothetical protein